MRLFVYGTLKRGYCRAYALQDEQFLSDVRTQPLYRMVNCGEYPGLVQMADGVSIEGELWEVSDECLVRLDEIEGVDIDLYRRDRVQLQPPYDEAFVLTYYYHQSIEGMPDCGVRWD